MNNKLIDEQTNRLFDAVLNLKTREECYQLFEDLCTVSELRAMSQRFHVAELLSEGRIYTDITQETGASTATISRVNRSLVYGTDGYKNALERLRKAKTAADEAEQ